MINKITFLRKMQVICIILCLTAITKAAAQDMIKVSQDTYIQSAGNAGNNYGANEKVIIKTNANDNIDRMGLLKFDFTALDGYDADNILSVRLYMGFHNSHNGVISFYEYTNAWDAATVKWNNAPVVAATVSDLSGWSLVNTLNAVSAWNGDTTAFHGGVDVTSYFKDRMEQDQIMSLALIAENSGQGYDLRATENTTPIAIEGQDNWGAYVEISYISDASNVLFESFDQETLPTGYGIPDGTFTVANSIVDVDMAQIGTAYRADLWYNQENLPTAGDFEFVPIVDKYIAIKFQGERPDGSLKFEMKTASGTWLNTEWNIEPDGEVVSAYGNHIYYFDLSQETQYTATTDIRVLHFKIADNVASESYKVDWIGTFSSIEAIDAFKDENDVQEAVNSTGPLAENNPVIIYSQTGSVSVHGITGQHNLKVYDMLGRVVSDTEINEAAPSVACPSGIYVVVLTGEKLAMTRKVIVRNY